jgi:sec-independent protein translocase protein TatC
MAVVRTFFSFPETFTNADPKEMTLAEHLEELRGRLIICLCAVGMGTVVGWFQVRPLFHLLVAPLLPYRRAGVRLVLGRLTDSFTIELKLALVAGVVLALPVLLYQTWLFVAPALAVPARRYVAQFLVLGVVLFALGASAGYAAFPLVVRFLTGQASNLADTQLLLQVADYVAQFALVLLVFGLIFELPLALALLALLGVVTSRSLCRRRRQAALIGLIVAMIITPGADPLTPLVTGTAIYLLYESGILLVRAMHR